MSGEIEQEFFDQYMLNEIKTKNDTLRQMVAIDALLMGAYSTLLFNYLLNIIVNPPLEEIEDFYIHNIGNLTEIRANIDYVMPGISKLIIPFIIISLALSPVFFWYLSIRRMLSELKDYDTGVLTAASSYGQALIDKEYNLSMVLSDGCYYMEIGLFVVVILIAICSLIIIM